MNLRALEQVYKYETIPYKRIDTGLYTACKYIPGRMVFSCSCTECEYNHGYNDKEVTCSYEYQSTRVRIQV